MSEHGFLVILPPVITILLAVRTKQVFVSLLAGIWLGWLVLSDFNVLEGSFETIKALVRVFQDPNNTQIIMFTTLIGVLILMVQKSGGVEGFILKISQLLEKQVQKNKGSNRVSVQLLAWLTGVLIFVEGYTSALVVGTLYRPIFDKLKIPREKLAYIVDSSCSPASVLMPFNAWGAFLISLLVTQGFDNAFSTLVQTTMYNFYPMLALVMVVFTIISKKDFGPMAKAEKRAIKEGKVLGDDAKPMMSEELTTANTKQGVTPKAFNMILPLITLIVTLPIMLVYTGWDTATLANETWTTKVLTAFTQGSGSISVLIALIVAILVGMFYYKIQGIMDMQEMVDLSLKGISSMMPLTLLMLLAFAIGGVCRELETGLYIAEVSKSWLSPALVPVLLFFISCFTAFSTGTSWGTFAIMIGIAVPIATTMSVNPHLAMAATLSGSIFGDHCSPISDSTILASMASASDHIDHVNTQIPYALVGGGIAASLFLLLGILI